MSNTLVTVAEIYSAAKETCSRLYIAGGGNPAHTWTVHPHPSTAAISFNSFGSGSWNLYMPAMPLNARLSRREADIALGYVIHELGHALHTDFGAYTRASGDGLGNLVNGLEDIRIEMMLLKHAGAATNARELLELLTEYTTNKALIGGWSHLNPASLPFTLYQVGVDRILGYAVASMPVMVFPLALEDLIAETMRRVNRSRNTGDIVAIARWLAGELKTMPQAPAPMPVKPASKPADGEGEGEGEKGTGTGDKPAQCAGDGEDEGEGEGSTGAAPSSDEPTSEGEGEGEGSSNADKPADTDAPEGASNGKGGNEPWDVSDTATDKPEVSLEDLGARVCERNDKSPAQVAQDNRAATDFLNASPCATRRRPGSSYTSPAATQRTADMIASAARLRRDVTRALRSPEMTANLRNETRGRFDMRNAARASAGAVNVFRRREDELGQAVACSFLIDMSSSMHGPCIRNAIALALHLGDAAKASSVPFEVLGFGCPNAMPNGPTATIIETKGFNDPWQEARDFVGAMVDAPHGGTSMMPALISAAERLRRKSGVTRRILLVLTDGQDQWGAGSIRAAVADARAKGVEVLLIGAGISVASLGVPSIDVMDLRKVATDGLKALADALAR